MRIIAVKTRKNHYKFINTQKIVDKVFFFMVAVLATYGFMDLILRANGF